MDEVLTKLSAQLVNSMLMVSLNIACSNTLLDLSLRNPDHEVLLLYKPSVVQLQLCIRIIKVEIEFSNQLWDQL